MLRLRYAFAVAVATSLAVTPASLLSAQGTAPAPASPSSDVTLLDAGAAPRRVLRYTFTKGATETISMRQQMGMAMEMNGMAMPAQSIPATLMDTKVDVVDVAANGAADVRVEIVKVDLDTTGANPMMLAQMRPALAPLNGVSMTYRIAPNGSVGNLVFSANAPPEVQAAQALGSTEQLSVALPTEAVGVGARWKASRAVQQNGITIQQEMEYTVTSLATDSVVLDLVLVQSAKDQKLALPGVPPGTDATLRSLDGRGTSSVTIRFNRVQPQMSMTLKALMVMEINAGGESATMNQTMTMDLKTVPTPPQ